MLGAPRTVSLAVELVHLLANCKSDHLILQHMQSLRCGPAVADRPQYSHGRCGPSGNYSARSRGNISLGYEQLLINPSQALAENHTYRLMQIAFGEGILDETVFRPVLLARAKSMTVLLREEGGIDDAVGLAC